MCAAATYSGKIFLELQMKKNGKWRLKSTAYGECEAIIVGERLCPGKTCCQVHIFNDINDVWQHSSNVIN